MAAVDKNEFFRQATLRIFSSLNSKTAMRRCMAYVKQFMPVSGMLFGLYDPDVNVGRLVAAIWPPDLPRPADTLMMPKAFWGWLKQRWAKTEGIQIINDCNAVDDTQRQLLTTLWPENASLLTLDLSLEDKRLGVLQLFVEGKHRYKKSHADLIAQLNEPFAMAMTNMLQHQEILRLKDILTDDNTYLRRQMMEITGDTIIGADFGLRGVMEMVHQVAPLDSPVLLMGETGVGKEVIANAIHYSSTRKNNPYIRVNCGAIPENLIDSELFGHEKGAFTGAISRKRGRFERADTGTIFLDEVGELPPAAQVRLLRVLQQREIERLGGTEVIPVDVRIISATHQNLEAMVRAGRFREDLWFRLNVFPIMIPPLRQRTDDIPALVSHFLERKSQELRIEKAPVITRKILDQFQAYHWPGNVRELENIVERALIQKHWRHPQVMEFKGGLPDADTGPASVVSQTEGAIASLDQAIADHIKKALIKTRGKVEGPDGAAFLLGIHPSTLRARMKKMGIPYGRNLRKKSSI